MYRNSLQGFSNFLEQWCFEIIDVSKYRTKLLTQKNLKILEGNEERMHAQANSSRCNIRFHYACLLEGLGRRRSLACTSGSTGIKMSIVDIVSARRRRAGLSRGKNLTNKTKPRVLAGKWRWRGGVGEKEESRWLPFWCISRRKVLLVTGMFAKRSPDLFAQIYMSRFSIGKFVKLQRAFIIYRDL